MKIHSCHCLLSAWISVWWTLTGCSRYVWMILSIFIWGRVVGARLYQPNEWGRSEDALGSWMWGAFITEGGAGQGLPLSESITPTQTGRQLTPLFSPTSAVSLIRWGLLPRGEMYCWNYPWPMLLESGGGICMPSRNDGNMILWERFCWKISLVVQGGICIYIYI